MDLSLVDIYLLEGRNNEGSSLSGTVLSSGKDVTFGEGNRDGFFLNRGGSFESGFKNTHEELSSEVHVLELEAFGGSDIFSLWTVIFCGKVQVGFPRVVIASV